MGVPFLADPDAGYFKNGIVDENYEYYKNQNALKLHVGSPSHQASRRLINGAIRAMKGKSGTRDGLEKELINNLINHLKETRGLVYQPDNIRMGMGVASLVTDVLFAIKNKSVVENKTGVTLFLPKPFWPNYTGMAEIAGVNIVWVDPENLNKDYLDSQSLDHNVQYALLLNSPNNPLGNIHKKKQLQSVGDWALERNAWVISDEIYSGLVMPDVSKKFKSIASLGLKRDGQSIYDRTIVLDGLSKVYAAAGLRFGFAAFSPRSGLGKYFTASTKPTMGALGAALFVYSHTQWALKYAKEHAEAIFKLSLPMRKVLDQYEIPYRPLEAGIFLYVDFSKLYGFKWKNPVTKQDETITENSFPGREGIFFIATGIGVVFFDEQMPGHVRFVMAQQDAEEGAARVQTFLENVEKKQKTDHAMLNPGGIDLNTSRIDFQIKHDREGSQLFLQYQNLQHIQLNGLRPIYIKDLPIADLSEFLESSTP